MKPYSKEFRGEVLSASDRGRATINGDLFLGWIRHHMVPTLQPGDLVVMDNLGGGHVLDRFTETECRNCFQHCGYRYT